MGYCVPFGWSGLFRSLGAQRPVGRPAPGGGPRLGAFWTGAGWALRRGFPRRLRRGSPAFFGRKPEERTPGRKRFFLPGPTFSGWGDPAGVLLLFLPGLRPMFPPPVTARPPAGRAGRGGCCSRKGKRPRPKPSPWGEGAPVRTLGRMRGRSCTQPFLVEVEKGGSRLSPQRSVSSAPLGKSVAPSSVTFGDSFPQGEASGLCSPTQKKRPKSGHVHGLRNRRNIASLRPTTPKPASGNERAIKKGVQGACPRPSFSPFLGRNGDPAGQAGPPGRCAPRHRKSPDHSQGTQYLTAPPPGTGREPTSQVWTCGGPEPDPLPAAGPLTPRRSAHSPPPSE